MPGQYYVYVPFDDAELINQANDWRSNMQIYKFKPDNSAPDPSKSLIATDPRKIPIVAVHGVTSGPNDIRNILGATSSDTIYILGHCSSGSDNLSTQYGHQKLNADGLAAQMVSDGLPTTHIHFKLFACNSGTQGWFTISFGEKLYNAMKYFPNKTLGTTTSLFPNVILTTYTKSVKTPISGFGPTGHEVHKVAFVKDKKERASAHSKKLNF